MVSVLEAFNTIQILLKQIYLSIYLFIFFVYLFIYVLYLFILFYLTLTFFIL